MRRPLLIQIKFPFFGLSSLSQMAPQISVAQTNGDINPLRKAHWPLWPSGHLDPLTLLLIAGVISFCLVQDLFNPLDFGAPARNQPSLVIRTSTGPHSFSIEVMRTVSELQEGLMYRSSLAENDGMLFDFQTEQPISMWMKNTFVPLDMIFLSRTGQITSIKENAEPFSESLISSNGPVYAVLEVKAGTAAKISLKIGDLIDHPIFRQKTKSHSLFL
jgi:uncharacterized membrane protein (UPF0127 family)